jgi:hypothetical protein
VDAGGVGGLAFFGEVAFDQCGDCLGGAVAGVGERLGQWEETTAVALRGGGQ